METIGVNSINPIDPKTLNPRPEDLSNIEKLKEVVLPRP